MMPNDLIIYSSLFDIICTMVTILTFVEYQQRDLVIHSANGGMWKECGLLPFCMLSFITWTTLDSGDTA